MRNWSKLGYYPTPPAVTEMIADRVGTLVCHTIPARHERPEQTGIRILDPCCGEGVAVARFGERLLDRANMRKQRVPEENLRVYGIELHRERASEARKRLFHVWNADIDNMRIRARSVEYLWLNPPYDWTPDVDGDGSSRLESRFLHQTTWALKAKGILIYIIPAHVLAHDARYLVRNYENIRAYRMPDEEYADYGQIVVVANRRETQEDIDRNDAVVARLTRMSRDPQLIQILEAGPGQTIWEETGGPGAVPARMVAHSPQEIAAAMAQEGVWNTREIRQMLDPEIDHTRIRPIQPLPEGHAAMVAANSMMDNIIIQDPAGQQDPIVLRGFFRKETRETNRTETQLTRTDFFESNIRALNTRTGRIDEMGSDPEGLKAFMDTYGETIQEHIAVTYPPAVDPESEGCLAIREKISELERPLFEAQLEAAVVGAAHLRNEKHLNMYFEQGSGKTCTSVGVAYGMGASRVAVMTPAGVVKNWVREISAVCPTAYIRVIDNDEPIGDRRPPTELEQTIPPARFARTSLEGARRIEGWATPESPLWVIFKKDSARRTHPTRQGLRWIGDHAPEEVPCHGHGMGGFAQMSRNAGSLTRKEAESPPPREKLLYRTQMGRLRILDEGSSPVGTCPQCWYPLTDDEKWKPKNRDAVCINPRPAREYVMNEALLEAFQKLEEAEPMVRGKYGGTWLSRDAVVPVRRLPADASLFGQRPGRSSGAEDGDEDEESLTVVKHCEAPIATAVREENGRARYSYGDYMSERMGQWFDLFIIDEVQHYKARETAQGETVRRMAQRSKKTIALTGTPFGGKVSEVFFLLMALNPSFGAEFGYRELGAFRKAYGREETIFAIKDDDRGFAAVGSHSRRRETKESVREIPGYHPALLEHFWHNTLFMSIHDVDRDGLLPTLRQRAELIPMDDRKRKGAYASQAAAYEELDEALSEHMKQYLFAGSKKPLGQYLQETLTYPENCWQGTAPEDPDTGEPIIVMPPLREDILYPKEQKLLELVLEQKARGRKCLVYCTHTGKRDTVARLLRILKERGLRVLQLKPGSVDSEERADWMANEAARNDVIICQPRLVEVGVNLLDYPTIIWFEIEYSMYMTEQASKRSYRITQRQPVEIYYLAYAGTMQERALRIIARKADVSRTFHGDLSKNGLSAFNPDPDDIREQLARELLDRTGQLRGMDEEDLEDLQNRLNDMMVEKDTGNDHALDDSDELPVEVVKRAEPQKAAPPVRTQYSNEGATQLAFLFD